MDIWQRLNNISPYAFVGGWLIVSCMQAAFTDVHNDESYYWVYIQQLQWGYYDHPPMVALFIKLGTVLLPGELGLRFMNVLAFAGSLIIWLQLINHGSRGYFYLLLLSMPFVNYLSFIVFPDGPLILFSSVFIWAFIRYQEERGRGYLIAMALSLAAMLYSKYHAVLVFPLLLLANRAYLRQWWPYLVGLGALVLFIPHLWWQYLWDFPSFRFHITGRAESFDWKEPLSFVLGQLLALGPVLLLALAHRPEGPQQRTIKTLVVGVLLFFFVASFRGVVHLQWTSVAYLPMLILASSAFSIRRSKWVVGAVSVFAVITLLLRIQLMAPIFLGDKIGPHYIHGQQEWAEGLADEVGTDILLFQYDLKEPSVYSFYTGQPSLALFPGYRKKSQYDLWHVEDTIQGRPVVVAQKSRFDGAKEFALGRRRVFIQRQTDFRSYQNIRIEVGEVTREEGRSQLKLTIVNHRPDPVILDQEFKLFLRRDDRVQEDIQLPHHEIVVAPSSYYELSVPVDGEIHGQFQVGIRGGVLSPSLNSGTFELPRPQ